MTPRSVFTLFFIAISLVLTPVYGSSDLKKPKHRNKHSKAQRSQTGPSRDQLPGQPYGQREDVMRMADDIAARRDLDPAWVRQTLAQARHVPSIPRLMLPPPRGTAKNWAAYRARFIEPMRIAAGLRFWQENEVWLKRAEQTYGVPPEIIVGILGVETIYGRNMGDFRVIDALATLAFDFPPAHPRAAERQAYFLGELEQFLSQCNLQGGDALEARGSYAGAMGMPQFMPSSWSRYAVDFDGDGRIDLNHSAADAIGSVANYFQAYHWQPGLPTQFALQFDAQRLDLDALLTPDILPTFSVAQLAAHGVQIEPAGADFSGKLALIELQNGTNPPSYLLGTDNFYAITRYNWSSYYAMAVIALGQTIAHRRAALDETGAH